MTEPEVKQEAINVQEITERATQAAREALESDFQAKLDESLSTVAQRAREEAEAGIIEKIAGKKEEEKWKPKDWEEVKESAAVEAERRIEAKLKAEKEAEQKQLTEAEEAKKSKEIELHKYWDAQVESMTKSNLLPELEPEIAQKMSKGEALSDSEKQLPSVRARQEIYKLAQEHKEPNLELVYYKYYGKQPLTPPVLGSSKSPNTHERPDYTYEEISGSSLEDLMKGVAS